MINKKNLIYLMQYNILNKNCNCLKSKYNKILETIKTMKMNKTFSKLK